MRGPIPIYHAANERYEADTCVGLVQAAERGEIQLHAVVHGHYPGRKLSWKVLPGLKTVGYWDAVNEQNWGLPWHRNEGIELTLLESGHLQFAVDASSYHLEPDSLTLTRPWQRHRVGDPGIGAGRLHWLILDVGVRRPNQEWQWPPWLLLRNAELKALTKIIRQNEQPVWKASPEIRHCFQEIARSLDSDDVTGNVSRFTVRLNDLFLSLLDLLQQKNVHLDKAHTTSQHAVRLFLNDLRDHPEHLAEQWSLADMADSCGLGLTQFVHHVRSLTNMTPARYVAHLRFTQAAHLLRGDHAISITDIALTTGFSSSQHFATAFASRFGCTPREFRMRAQAPSYSCRA